MNSISAPRDDFGLIEHQAQRARRGLIPQAAAVRQYPAPDTQARPDLPARRIPRGPVTAADGAMPVWRGPERRRRRVPVLLDTRARAGATLDLTA